MINLIWDYTSSKAGKEWEILAEWMLFLWWAFEKKKQIGNHLKKLFSVYLTSINLGAGRNQKPYSQHFPFYWVGNWVTTKGTELTKANQPDGGPAKKPRSPHTHTDSSLHCQTLGEGILLISKDTEWELKGFLWEIFMLLWENKKR